MHETTRVRINLTSREFEVEGTEEFVSRYTERFEELLGMLVGNAGSSSATPIIPTGQPDVPSTNGASGSFGEFFSRMPKSAKDVDNVLVAAHYAQFHNADQTFATAEVNKLLKEQGVKISNPSQCVRANVSAKKVFAAEKGKFKVSRAGQEYVQRMIDGALGS